MGNRKPWVANRSVALWGGVGAYLLGSVLLYDAYERRGRERPFLLRFLPS
jgi:hypothetical protein